MIRQLGCVGRAAMLAALGAVACRPAPAALLERLDVHVGVTADGGVEVVETATARFPVAGAVFERAIDGTWADEMSLMSATIDGAPLAAAGDVQFAASAGKALGVRVTARGPSTVAREIALRYRVEGGVGLEGPRGLLTLPIVRADRREAIGHVTGTLELPIGIEPLDGSGVAEAGWTVERRPRGLFAARDSLPPGEGATLMAQFEIQRGAVPEPAWQRHQVQARNLAPAFISGGLFILVIGAGVLWIIRLQYATKARDAVVAERAEVRRGLWFAGLACLGLALLTAIAAHWLLGHLGPWPQALPISIFVVGAGFLVVHRRWV
ncbi:MAG: DUF2207 domain-containing protein [Acidobacteria bacterium]|nr:DUF2207 domain-containing protein [Acidobacteriota bacterium]